MAKRSIIKIDEEKCNGCGLCASACAEGAIAIINGKARLISETYCDGLGACIGHCPQDAITIEQREAEAFDEAAVHEHLKKSNQPAERKAAEVGFVCPGMKMVYRLDPPAAKTTSAAPAASALRQWPVQISLVSPQASYFADADLLVAADCVPIAMGDFHSTLLAGRAVAIGCPKFDDNGSAVQKLSEIIKHNRLKSLTVARMEVPCCSGLTRIVQAALQLSGVSMPMEEVFISLDGGIKERKIYNQ